MSKLNWSKYKQWSVYLLAIPVILLFIIEFKYLINASETLNGNYSYEFMFGADSIPTPWYMKTAELFFKYCLWYGMSITVLTIGYLIAVLKNKKSIQITIGLISLVYLYYEFRMFLESAP